MPSRSITYLLRDTVQASQIVLVIFNFQLALLLLAFVSVCPVSDVEYSHTPLTCQHPIFKKMHFFRFFLFFKKLCPFEYRDNLAKPIGSAVWFDRQKNEAQ